MGRRQTSVAPESLSCQLPRGVSLTEPSVSLMLKIHVFHPTQPLKKIILSPQYPSGKIEIRTNNGEKLAVLSLLSPELRTLHFMVDLKDFQQQFCLNNAG